MITQEMAIYPNRERGITRFYAVQGESGARNLVFALYDAQGAEVDASNARALLYVIKPDRNVAVIECKTSPVEPQNKVSCLLTLQAAACPGLCSMFLQVLTDTGELRYDNLELLVQPSDIDSIVSRSDFGPLGTLLQSAGKINLLLANIQDLTDFTKDVLQRYTDEISPFISGEAESNAGDKENHHAVAAYDTAGNLLLVDARNWGGPHTKLSTDNGNTWTDAPLQDAASTSTDLFKACIGGEKFLCIGDKYIVWVQVSGGKAIAGSPLTNPIKSNVSPIAKGGRYLNGKYFVFRTQRSGTESTAAFPPVYFTGSGAAYTEINLPDSQMDACDIAYDPESGLYFMVGQYTMTSPKFRTNWLLKSANLTSWTTVKTWTDDTYGYKLAVFGGMVNIYPLNAGVLKVHQVEISTGKSADLTFQPDKAFYALEAAAQPMANIVVGSDKLAYSKDGKNYQILSFTWPEAVSSDTSVAVYGRVIVVTNGPYYQVFRMDYIGENIGSVLESISSIQAEISKWFTQSQAQFAEQIGRKVIFTDKDPGIGKSAEEGAIYFVYESW